jgi:hypothetical protein
MRDSGYDLRFDSRYEIRDAGYPVSGSMFQVSGTRSDFLQELTELTEMNSTLFPLFSPVRNKRRGKILCSISENLYWLVSRYSLC